MVPIQSGDKPALPASVGNYRIEARLGAGGMGVVYSGFDEALKRPLALKHLPPDPTNPTASLRFRREAQAAARLNHPAIVHIYDIVETPEGIWIVMELVEGQSLKRQIGEKGLDLPDAVRLGREVAEGLAEAHAQGVIHRDLKASNVMITAYGHAKILDFGIAKLAEPGEPELTGEGTVLGTYHAMSPEQIQGLPVDSRSDLFSLGSLLYEMLTGTAPFRAWSPHEAFYRICNQEPPPVCQVRPEVPRELSDLVYQLLRKDPRQRPQSAREVARSLDDRLLAKSSGSVASPRWQEASSEITLLEGPARHPRTLPSVELGTPPSLSSRPARERRQMTVVCCELVEAGETGLSSSATFDPEILYELMHNVRDLAAEVAGRYDGHLGNPWGNRILIYFGYPQPHEDNARRAVQTALELIREAPQRIAAAAGPSARLAVRAGLHSGLAVVATDHASEPVTLGATLDLAVLLLALAGPGSVVVSPATCALLGKGVATEELPPVRLSGLSEPLTPYRVLQVLEAPEESTADLPPLVGREAEMAKLLDLWLLAREGTGQVVLLSGEPGIGKSRLVLALRERLEGTATWLSCHGSPYNLNSPLNPVVSLLTKAVASAEGSSQSARLRALLADLGQEDAAPFLAALLNLPPEDRPPTPEMPPDRLRDKTLNALVALVLGLAEQRPLVLLVEDLHWLDPTSLSWLDRLLDEAMTSPLLVVLTLRLHTMEALWGPRAYLTSFTLQPLSEAEAERLIDRVLGERLLPASVRQRIVARTDGVPLFLEELTKAVIESERSGEHGDLPATLRDSLTARLDRLGAAKEVAQLGSVLGRTFSLELLAAVSNRDEATLHRELRRLVQSELVQRRGSGREARYLFKHALIQDAAYDSLLKRERQRLHRRIAETLRDRFPEIAEAQPELLAHHYTEAGCIEPAVDAWYRAGVLASSRSATRETIRHLEQALELLADLPEGPDRDRRELGIQSALAAAMIAGSGFLDPAVEQGYARADLLAERLGETEERFWAVIGLHTYHVARGTFEEAYRLVGLLKEIAEASGSAALRSIACFWLGTYLYYRADFAAALPELEKAYELAPPGDSSYRLRTGVDLRVLTLAFSALVLWHRGYPDQARRRGEQAIALAQEIAQPFTLAFGRGLGGAVLGHYLRDPEMVRREAGEVYDLAIRLSFPLWSWQTAFFLIWMASSTHAEAAPQEEVLKAADADKIEQLAGGAMDYYFCLHAEILLLQGRTSEARDALEKIVPRIEAQGEPAWSGELRRLQGEILAAGPELDAAQRCFETALARARKSGSRALELRAALSLGRLWRSQGREKEARALVASVHRGFTEGFEHPDLREAAAFLALDSEGDR